MNKEQALHRFWSSFGMLAYDGSTVPDDITLPYISYEVYTGDLGGRFLISASIWDRSNSWQKVTETASAMAQYITDMTPIRLDNGYLWITKGNPFSQRMSDPDDTIRRLIINIEVEYLTSY